MRKLTHFRCRRLTSLAMFAASILLASLGGCSPAQPPSMAGGAPLVSWDHLKTERWRYQLSSESEIAEYRFETNGTVACTIGKKDIIDPVYGNEPMNTVYGVVAKWEILDTGDLQIHDDESGQSHTRLRIVTLDHDSASALNPTTGQTRVFTRKYTP